MDAVNRALIQQDFPMITGRKIRLAIVGCGRISKNHFGSIDKHADNIEQAAVCDNDAKVLAEHAERYKAPDYLHLDDMLKNEQIDLVGLCTPSGMHSDQTVTVARNGVHVMTEKPMATRWQDGVRMVKAYDEYRAVKTAWPDMLETLETVSREG